MIGFFIPIAEALIAGYVAAVAVYMLLMLLLTRLGRRVLISNSRPRWIYTALHAATWCLAALAGGYICCHLSPIAPWGLVGFPLCLTLALTFVLLRSFRQLPGQMSGAALALNFLGILAGTAVALYANHVFLLLKS